MVIVIWRIQIFVIWEAYSYNFRACILWYIVYMYINFLMIRMIATSHKIQENLNPVRNTNHMGNTVQFEPITSYAL